MKQVVEEIEDRFKEKIHPKRDVTPNDKYHYSRVEESGSTRFVNGTPIEKSNAVSKIKYSY